MSPGLWHFIKADGRNRANVASAGQQKLPVLLKWLQLLVSANVYVEKELGVQSCSLTTWLDAEGDRGHQYINMGVDGHVVTLCHLLLMFLCWFVIAG